MVGEAAGALENRSSGEAGVEARRKGAKENGGAKAERLGVLSGSEGCLLGRTQARQQPQHQGPRRPGKLKEPPVKHSRATAGTPCRGF